MVFDEVERQYALADRAVLEDYARTEIGKGRILLTSA